jgi:hypothetical protein
LGKAGLKTSWLISVNSSLREGSRQSLRPEARTPFISLIKSWDWRSGTM